MDRRGVVLLAAVLGAVALTAAAGGAGAGRVNWPSYMYRAWHPSTNAVATAITPANAGSLTQAWNWLPDPPTMPGQPPGQLFSSPVVYNGRIFLGANTGVFYALDESTGNVLWSRFLGFVTAKTCEARGFTSTATVARDPSAGVATVYTYAPDGYIYALRADSGSLVWRSLVAIPSDTVNDFYAWGSPAVVNGHVYVPISSQCDMPRVQGGLKEFDQVSGALLNTYHSVPDGEVGASIWSSPAATSDGSSVWVTTGNGTHENPAQFDSMSVVLLDGNTLAKLDIWQVPPAEQVHDGDFGGSPTLFRATINGKLTKLVGACNKNGKYYALRRSRLSQGPVWSFQAGDAEGVGNGLCIAGAVWDGSRLFVAGNETTIGDTDYEGSIRELDPATGTPVWETGLTGTVLGSPTENGSGVLAVASFDIFSPTAANRAWLVNAADGTILNTIDLNSSIFAQPIWADNYLLVATKKYGLFAFKP